MPFDESYCPGKPEINETTTLLGCYGVHVFVIITIFGENLSSKI
jgi:hypothetical protein